MFQLQSSKWVKLLLSISLTLLVGPNPVTLLQEGGQTYLIQDGEKKLTQSPISTMAPTGSYISYLAAADNVQPCAEKSALAGVVACYTYIINGQRFAEFTRDQLQTMLDNNPTALPPGASVRVAPSPQLMQMSGTGMVMLNANNLPVRMVLDITTPEVSPLYDAKTHAIVDFEFDPTHVETAIAALATPESFLSRLNPANIDFTGLFVFVCVRKTRHRNRV